VDFGHMVGHIEQLQSGSGHMAGWVASRI